MQHLYEEMDMLPLYAKPADFGKFVQKQILKWAPVARRCGAKVD